MVVYVDILLFVNAIVNYAVLMTTEKLLKRDCRLYRILSGAFIGALFSLLIFADSDRRLLLFGLRVLSSAVVTLVTFGWKSKAEFFKALILNTVVSLLYCGCIILFYQIFKPPNMLIVNNVPYLQIDPLLLTALTALIYIIIVLIYRLLSERIKNTIVSLRFVINQKTYSCIAKIDTGCNLIEPFSSSPVIIVDRTVFSIGSEDPKRIVPYTTISGSSFLYAVKAAQVVIDKKPVEKEIYIAVSDIADPNYQAIINSDIIR